MLSRAGVVYRIPCSCGKEYIGETKRALETRLKEHQGATRRVEVEKSAIAEHALAEQHRPAWDKITVFKQARRDLMILWRDLMDQGGILHCHG